MSMNAAIKAQWTAALRSGDYPQAKNNLRTEEGYCCLGVLCDLAVEAGVTEITTEPGDSSAVYWYDGEFLSLPGSVQKWAGLDYLDNPHNPDIDREADGFPEAAVVDGEVSGHAASLAELNDNGTTFAVIADIIDAQF